MGWIAITASDALAVSMIGVILLGSGIVLLIVLCIRKAASRRDAAVDSLLEEVAAAEAAHPPPKRGDIPKPRNPPPTEPWAKDSDWWKNG
jgi:hypothetical protein